MNEKKDLDRLFQEKFKDFEVAPPEFVWENIQEALQEKKKRRVVPLWFKLSGVAALLVLSGLIATLFINDSDNPANTNPVVLENNNASPATTDALPGSAPANATDPSATGKGNADAPFSNESTATAAASANSIDENTNNAATANATRQSGALSGAGTSTAVASGEKNNSIINQTNFEKERRTIGIQERNAVAASQKTSRNQQQKGIANRVNDQRNADSNPNNGIAAATQSKSNNDANAAQNRTAGSGSTNTVTPTDNNSIAAAGLDSNEATKAITQNNRTEQHIDASPLSTNAVAASTQNGTRNNSNDLPANATTTTGRYNKAAIITDKDIVTTEAVTATDTDTTQVNELELLYQQRLNGDTPDEDKQLAENEPKQRWNIKPQVAPVFYNSLSAGSPINEQFASNSKSYDNQVSFGVGVNYAVNDRISIRSGINSVNLSYATNDIAFYASLNGATSNIGQARDGNIVVDNPGNVPEVVLIDGQPVQAAVGSMVQKTGYVEVPLEMSYALFNKKFGIDLIGGFSTLFLNQNNVSVVSSTGLSTQVGQAQNLNDIHFSTNVGVGFKYRFWDAFQASFEPTFKYQVNAYSRDAGNFKPYFIGLYTGVSFSF